MPTILDEIVAAKRQELAQQQEQFPLAVLETSIASQPPPLDLAAALGGRTVSLIAEVKKASPSRGLLCPDFDPVRLAGIYSENGAAAISVLTDPRFQGELEHIVGIREAAVAPKTPVLRKDFIFDRYQLHEARAIGADALLLIVAILTLKQLQEFLEETRELGMQCLVEVHDEEELELAVNSGADIIGINNRDLRTFSTDLAVTQRLAPMVPKRKIIVSESGISSPEHLRLLGQLGVNAVLVGEALVTAPDVAAKVRELAGNSVPTRTP